MVFVCILHCCLVASPPVVHCTFHNNRPNFLSKPQIARALVGCSTAFVDIVILIDGLRLGMFWLTTGVQFCCFATLTGARVELVIGRQTNWHDDLMSWFVAPIRFVQSNGSPLWRQISSSLPKLCCANVKVFPHKCKPSLLLHLLTHADDKAQQTLCSSLRHANVWRRTGVNQLQLSLCSSSVRSVSSNEAADLTWLPPNWRRRKMIFSRKRRRLSSSFDLTNGHLNAKSFPHRSARWEVAVNRSA